MGKEIIIKKRYTLLSALFLIYWGCEEDAEPEPDTTPPTVSISYPLTNSTVSEMVTINCISSDNEGVEKAELWINGVSTELTDNSEPYSFDWNTTTLEDGNYTIIIRSYDTNENTTDSDPIVLTVDNTQSNPTSVELYPITYSDGFQISWSQNNDDDFQSYKLFESSSEDMSKQILIYETGNISDTTFIKSFQNFIYHRLVIEDIWGFQSTSNIEVGDYEVELWGNLYSVLNTTELQLTNSGLTGSIPPEIGNLTNLTYLDLYKNELTDSIPSEIANLTNLTHLYLGNNQFSGQIPESICDLNIDWKNNFNIFNNQLCPPYPSCIEDYVGGQDTSDCEPLVTFECTADDGTDGVELWNVCYSIENTTELDLSNNQLTGSIPSEIGNLTNLSHLNLKSNHLSGSIPPEIGYLTNLSNLYLDYNQLTGEIPSEISNLENLTYLLLSYNLLNNELPLDIFDLATLETLLLDNNNFSGEIPSEIGNLTSLNTLKLENNDFSGLLPESICLLENLDFTSQGHFEIFGNALCPPYPSCVEDYVGEQDASDCD